MERTGWWFNPNRNVLVLELPLRLPGGSMTRSARQELTSQTCSHERNVGRFCRERVSFHQETIGMRSAIQERQSQEV
jgi:hypothetical protein